MWKKVLHTIRASKILPHGKPISEGRCCKESVKAIRGVVSNIADVFKGAKGKVAYLHTKDNKNSRN